ncbi:enoyl-CoA hydratase/isomerase family protein [Sphaerisporangium sp. NPDC051011]|uniref:enoyl-CoA hydratase/isomerase family protein n=1 Tax=Sphaerisporangium sp. NPDC051011 TaxID=3155792 RepID=UPI0033FCCE34
MPVLLDVDRRGRAMLTLDRYAKRNSLDQAMLESLGDALGAVETDPAVRCVVVRGGNGFFCAGADISDWADPGPDRADRLSRLGTATFARLAALHVPTIALIERSALGGGLELALACDLRVTTEDAALGYPEARLGNLTAWGGIARLVDTVGLAHARRLFLTATPISGAEAARIGLVTEAVTGDRLETAAEELVEAVIACDPLALRVVKDTLAGYATRVPAEPTFAAFFSLSDASRARKQAFFQRKPTTK